MMRCDDCRTLLLDHLYGLLDPASAAAVEGHLAGCPGCAAARDQAARARGLLARAAKVEFPGVRFAPPAGETVPADGSTSPTAVPSSFPLPKPPPRGTWLRWAVAAGVLAMVPGALLPLNRLAGRYEHARREAEAAAARTADARRDADRATADARKKVEDAEARHAAAKQAHDAVLGEWLAAEQAADRADRDRKFAVSVVKPVAVQPGAPNEFEVAVADPGKALAGRRVEAEVRDQADAVLFRQRIDPERNAGDPQRVRVPADVWAKVGPQSELFLAVAAVDEKTGARAEIQEKVRLFGPVYATMLATDKASYRPGERVYFRSLTLDRVTFRPPAREQVLHFELRRVDGKPADRPVGAVTGTTRPVRVSGGKVEPVLGPDGGPLRGVGCGAFDLPPNLPDGDYALTLTELPGPAGYPPAVPFPVTRTVKVRSGAAERYHKKVTFGKASYTPGEMVQATVEVKFQDKPLPDAKVDAVVTADGEPVPFRLKPVTGPDGRTTLTFTLPRNLPRGDVRLKATVRANDVEESVAEWVPVVGPNVVVEFFPEGGKLVAGVPNRVYVRATAPTGKAADIRGTVTDGTDTGAEVRTLTSEAEPGVNRGLGSFTFTPKAGARYRLTMDHPAGADPVALPVVEAEGVVMTVSDTVTAPGQPVRVRVYSVGRPRNLVVGAYTRGRLADTKRVTAAPGKAAEVQLMAGDDPRGGVTRITVFEDPNGDDTAPGARADLAPVAERLVFRKPGEVLNLAVSAGPGGPQSFFAPGSPVELTVTATDEKGNPAPAVLWAAVVNTAVPEDPKARLLPTHFLLAGEVQTPDDLEYADFLLTDHPRAAESLDMVLATQGWRRFVEQSAGPAGVARGPGPVGPRNRDAERLLAMNGQYPVPVEPGVVRQHRLLFERFWPRYESSAKDLEAAEKAKGAAAADKSAQTTAAGLLAAYDASRRQTAGLVAAADEAAEPLRATRRWVWPAVGGLAVLALGCAAVGFARPSGVRGTLPLAVAAVGAGGLAVFLAVSRPEVADLPRVAEVDGTVTPPRDAPGGPDVAPPPRVKSDAPVSPGPELRSPVVKGPNTIRPGDQKGPITATFPGKGPSGTSPEAVGPSIPMLPGAGAPPDRLNWPLGADPRHLIPDDLIGPKKDGPERAVSRPRAAPVRDEQDPLWQVAAVTNERADATARRMDATLGDRQPTDPAAFNRVRSSVPRTPPLVVREYAAPRPGSQVPDAGVDPDTVLWQPVIVLPADGKTTLSFHPGKTPGGYQVVVAGHTPDGRLGAVRTVLRVAPGATGNPNPTK